MTFPEIEYVRPDMASLKQQYASLLDEFDNADSFEKQTRVLEEFNKKLEDPEFNYEVMRLGMQLQESGVLNHEKLMIIDSWASGGTALFIKLVIK